MPDRSVESKVSVYGSVTVVDFRDTWSVMSPDQIASKIRMAIEQCDKVGEAALHYASFGDDYIANDPSTKGLGIMNLTDIVQAADSVVRLTNECGQCGVEDGSCPFDNVGILGVADAVELYSLYTDNPTE